MANVVPTAYTAPELNGLVPRENILASDTQAVLNAANFLIARGAPLVHQCWNRAEGVFSRTAALYAAAGNALWRIPPLGARTDVACVAHVNVVGAAANMRVRSVNSGIAVASGVLAPGEQWVTFGALTCAFGPGYDDLILDVAGDAADPIIVHTFYAEFAPQASPLAAGTGADDVTAFDEAEAAADEPIAADMLDYLRRDLVAMFARQRGIYTWSGLNDVDSAAIAPPYMPSWPHRLWSHVMPGSEVATPPLVWQVHVNAYNGSGAVDQIVSVWHGGGDIHGRSEHVTDETIPAAAVAAAWYDFQVQPGEERPLSEMGVPHMLASVSVHPDFVIAGLGSEGRTTAIVLSISIWGA